MPPSGKNREPVGPRRGKLHTVFFNTSTSDKTEFDLLGPLLEDLGGIPSTSGKVPSIPKRQSSRREGYFEKAGTAYTA